MADTTADEIGTWIAEDILDELVKADPSQSQVNDDYDPSDPTVEKELAAGITPSKLKVLELRTELNSRGMDIKGNKAALVERLEEALGLPPSSTELSGSVMDRSDGTGADAASATAAAVESMEEEAAAAASSNDCDTTSTEDLDPQDMEVEAGASDGKAQAEGAEQGSKVPEETPAQEAVAPAPAPTAEPLGNTATKEGVAPTGAANVKVENGASADTKEDANTEQGPPAELAKYWKAVKDKPTDFTGWTYLLQYVEQQGHMPSVRDAFDAFLARYPYCYGYWKKYADLERKKADNVQKAKEVFEAGLKAIPLSSDLWMQHIQFVGQTSSPEEVTDKLREVYCKAITAAGTDFRSDKLWDMYINFEKEEEDWPRVTKIYDQLLTIPTQLYSHHFEKFKEHVSKHHPKDILSVDEFIRLRMEVVEALGVAEPGSDEGEEMGEEGPPGEDDAPPGVEVAPPGMDLPSAKQAASSKQVEAENEAIRKKVLESRTAIHKQTEQEVSKRWAFEEGIRRPYFHAKALEKSQLKNWREYLDFETDNGTHERVLILYERCLVACALYEEFWIRYAKYLEPHSIEGVSSVYKRACTIHLPKKPSIHLRWAAFEERQGSASSAQEILQKLEENVPDLIMVTLERISLERRLGNAQAVVAILKERLQAHKKPEIKLFFSLKLSRYYMKVLHDIAGARSALYEALEQVKDKATLYLQLLDLEMQQRPSNESIILDLLQKAIDFSTDLDGKMRFSQRRLTYLMDFGIDVTKLQSAYDAHQTILKEQLEVQQSAKKRNGEAGEGTPAAQPAKKAKREDSLPTAAAAAAAAGKAAAAAAASKAQSQPPQPQTQTQPQTQPPSQPLLSSPAPPNPAPQANQDYSNQGPTGSWGGYNQAPYGQQGGNYNPMPPAPGGYNQPPPNYNQQYQQYQQAWGNYNQGYYPR